jgi:tetratricopeptide (TPR) repeat protein
MHRLAVSAAIAAGIALLAPAAAHADDRADCYNSKSEPDAGIRACSHLISSGRLQTAALATTYYWRTTFWRRKGEWDQVISDSSRVLELGGTNKDGVYLERGIAWTFKREFDHALADFDRAIALAPNGQEGYSGRAEVYISKGEYARAMPDLDQAIRQAPNDPGPYHHRGFAYELLKDYDHAIADFDAAIRLNAKKPFFFHSRANTWIAKGDLDRAIADFDQAIRLDSTVATFFSSRCSAWREKGEFDRALADCDQAIALDRKLSIPVIGRALIWRAKGEFDRAIAEYDKAIDLDPRLPAAYTGRGLALEGKGDIESAKRDFRTALSLRSGEFVNIRPDKQVIDTAADHYKNIAAARLVALSDAESPRALPQNSTKKSDAAGPAGTLGPNDAGRRIALVIGNGAYVSATPLPNPPNDAHALAKSLREMGFEVSEGINLDRDGMQRRTHEFLRSAATARLALVFYAGHGIQIDGRNYLVPVDARIDSAENLVSQMTDVPTLLAGLDDEIRTNIVILDACRDNPLAHQATQIAASRSVAVRSGLAAPTDLGKGEALGAGTLIAFATAPGQIALDGEGSNSPFSAALARHISTPGLEVQQMLTRVRAEVVATTKSKQVPWSNSSLLGEVYLVGRP